MAAIIRSQIAAKPDHVGTSRDDLEAGDVVTVVADDLTPTTYAWSIVYKPEGSAATLSGDVTLPGPLTFTVDLEGPYLIRLITDLGTPDESQQFVRLRYLTNFGQLHLVAGGEQLNSTIPVPVDIDPQGWADDQNRNLTTLLGFIQPLVASGDVITVDAGIGGDFSTIQAAINQAVLDGASLSDPAVVLVRPGLYIEDVAFAPHVAVLGWPGNTSGTSDMEIVRVRAASATCHTAAMPAATDQVVLANLTLENQFASTTPVLAKTGSGSITAFRCDLSQLAIDPTQGAAFGISGGTATLDGCLVRMTAGAAADRVALSQRDATTLTLLNCRILGPSGMRLNDTLLTGTTCTGRDCRITATGGAGSAAIFTDAEELTLEYCRIESTVSDTIQVHPGGAAFAGDVSLTLRWCFISGDVDYDVTGLAGTSDLNLGSVEYGSLSLPGGAPSSITATTKSSTLFYDNTTSLPDITATTVQDALDQIYAYASEVRTLDDAYDGGPADIGAGRTIVADQGSVDIVDAVAPSDPPSPANSDGRLRAVGGVEVGALGFPEILLDPNPYGQGPLLQMGSRVVANNAPNVVGDALIFGNATGSPSFRNYGLRVGTQSSLGGSNIGNLHLRAGDGLPNGASTPDAGSVYVQAGSGFDAAAGASGDLWLIPGDSAFGPVGGIFLSRPQDMTPATLTAAGAFVGGVTGTVRFATNMGAIEVDIDAADGLAAVIAKFDATGQVTAADSGGGVLELTTVALGPDATIYFLNADTGLDTALGVFDGQAPVAGTAPSYIRVDVTAAQEITFGADGATGPMIYNADTGKLTVPGIIDPTGLVLDETVPLVAPTGKGVIFIGDGTGGTIAGNFYFRYEGGALQDVSAGIGGSTTVSVEDEGVGLGGFNILNFAGSAVTATNDGGGRALITITAGGFDGEDEGVSVGTGFDTINFVGGGVTASDAGGGTLDVTVATGGIKIERESFAASSFAFAGGISTVTVSQTPDFNADFTGVIELYRNGVADMTLVGGPPSTVTEFRLNGTTLEIGADITATGDTFKIVYPKT